MFLISCSREAPISEEQLELTKDDVIQLDRQVVGDKKFVLVKRISGFANGLEYIEIYGGNVEFDNYGNASTKPLFSRSMAETLPSANSRHVKGGKLEMDKKRIYLQYQNSDGEFFFLSDMK